MGTRTYSRRAANGTRYLTPAGIARFYRDMGVANADIRESKMPLTQSFQPSYDYGENASINIRDMGQIYKKNIKQIQESTSESVDDYLDSLPKEEVKKNKNSLALAAIAMSGTAEQRVRAIQMLLDSDIPRYSEIFATLELGSMDYWYMTSTDEQDFVRKFWRRWSNTFEPYTTAVGWAQIHSYFADIGPNRGKPYPPDFYDDRPVIQLNPKIVDVLQREYEKGQRMLEESGYPEDGIELYRGTKQPRGLSLESFTALPSVAQMFANAGGSSGGASGAKAGDIRTEKIPRRYIMSTYAIAPEWKDKIEDEVMGKEEYMVLGTGYYADKGIVRSAPASATKFKIISPLEREY